MHLYVHIPFCVRRCSYCDFSIAVRKRIPAREYVEAILAEASVDPGPPARGEPELETLYLGGGTPSLLPAESLGALLHDLADPRRRPHAARLEVTLEANPEDVTPDNARAWRAAGVNRVSLGAQSFDDRVLQWMHRSHDAARIGEAVRTLRGAGIDNISLDLIFALPTALDRDWERDLDAAISLLPSHISLYGLTVEPRTPLDRWISRGAVHPADDDRYADEYLLAHRRLTAEGYQFYEVSNASRPGFRSRHNSAYWSGASYVGLGPAAHSFDGRVRRWNLAAWEAYRAAIAAGQSPIESEEVLTGAQRELERLYLALRTSEGVPVTVLDRPGATWTALESAGWLTRDGDRVRCTPTGWLRLDALVAKLFDVKELSLP